LKKTEPNGAPSRKPQIWCRISSGKKRGLPNDDQNPPNEFTGQGWHPCRIWCSNTKTRGEVEAPKKSYLLPKPSQASVGICRETCRKHEMWPHSKKQSTNPTPKRDVGSVMHTQNPKYKSKKKNHLASQAISTLIQLTTNKQPITLLRPKSTTQRPQTTNHQLHDPDALYSSQTTQRTPSSPRSKFNISVQIQTKFMVHKNLMLDIGQMVKLVTTVTFQISVHRPLTL